MPRFSNAVRAGRTPLMVALVAGLVSIPVTATSSSGDDPHADLPDTLQLTGVVRDFQEKSVSGGHPNFEQKPSGGFGHYAYIVADELDDEGNPVFASTGYKINSQWKDDKGRVIMPPRTHLPAVQGGSNGSKASSTGGATTTAADFSKWYRDVPGTNLSKPLTINLQRKAGTNVYVFDDKSDPTYSSLGGFFPINGQLYGNSKNDNKNFHFTYEIETEFTYEADSGQVFTFIGDDDVWVFIDGKCVIDIGGVHGATSQTIDLDRLTWLEDGETYQLKFFFAERHRTQSNFRIETTLQLKSVDLPTTSALYD